jgi:ATP-binding cassette subfamily F protein 3
MEKVVTHVVGIHRNKIRKMKGGPQKLLDQIKLEEEVYEKTRQNQIKKIEKTEDFIRKFRAGARSAGLVQSRIKSLAKQDIHNALEYIPQITFKFHYKIYEGNTLIKTNNLGFSYDNNPLLENITLETLPGDKIAVIGKNGRGKSTLLKLLAQQLEPTSGTIKVNPSLSIGYFGQESKENLNAHKSILEEFVAIPGINEQEARKMCSLLLFDAESIKKRISVLSGGEKNRVCLGKAILQTTQILILDEPTNHLDLESAQALIQAMQEFKGLLIFVSHDENMIQRVANRLIVFDNNQQTVINENYDYFLKNRGWSDENLNITQTLTTQNGGEQKQIQSKIDQQQKRLIQKKQAALEKNIAKLEQQEIENGKKLADACFEKNHQKIKEYGQKAKDLHDQINELFQEFDLLLKQEEQLTS